jgi:hypothetical protein
MASQKELQRFTRLATREIAAPTLEDTENRLRSLSRIALDAAPYVALPWGMDVPDADISLRLLEVSVDIIPAVDWLGTLLTVDGTFGCWALPLPLEYDSKGRARYPTLNNVSLEAKGELAHRFVVRRMIGTLATHEHLDHVCRNHACCNPTHLDIVTHEANVRRGSIARRAVNGQQRLY